MTQSPPVTKLGSRRDHPTFAKESVMIDRTERTLFLRPECLLGAILSVVAGAFILGNTDLNWWWPALVIVVAIGGPIITLLAIGYLRGREFIAYAAQRISYTCPRCARSGRPAYKCPGCGRTHDDLIPGIYGLFRARCGNPPCIASLPTCVAAGRDRLQKACQRCGADIPHAAVGTRPEYRIALVGAASSGKSNLLVTAIWQLKERFAPENGLKVTFADATEEKQYDRLVNQLKSGIPMTKTWDRLPALTVGLEDEDGEGSCLLHLFDAAGEHFADESALRDHPIEGADAIIFVVDPFAEEAVYRGALGDLDSLVLSRANAAVEQAQYIAARLVNVLEQKLVNPNSRFHIPVAVVVTKVDVAGVGKRYRVGSTDLARRFTTFAAAVDRAEREEARVLTLLHDIGLGNLVQLFEARFDVVGYFAASPLGRSLADDPNRGFEPRGVVPPLVWLCGAMSALGDTDPVHVFLTNTHLFTVRCLRGLEGRGMRQLLWAVLLGGLTIGILIAILLPGPLKVLYGIVVIPVVLLYISLVYTLVYQRVVDD